MPGYNEVVAFVRRVRHDANSPLTAALGNVQLLLEEVEEPETVETLRVVESELRRLNQILKQLSEIQPQPE